MNIKKVFVAFALLVPLILAPSAIAQGCGQANGWQQNSWQQQHHYGKQQRKLQRKMQKRMAAQWQQRQLASNDPNYSYWRQNPSEYQSLWRSQQELDALIKNGVISANDKALLEAQMAAYALQQQNQYANAINYNNGYGYGQNVDYSRQSPYNYNNQNGGLLNNLLGGTTGNASTPYVNSALPGILQRLASYWGQNQTTGL